MENHYSDELPGINWRIQKVKKNKAFELCYQGEVDFVESVETEKVEVTCSVAMNKQVDAQDKGAVWGMVGYAWGMLGYVWGMVAGSVVSDKQVEVYGWPSPS